MLRRLSLEALLARPARLLAVLVPLALLLALPAARVRFGGTLLDLLPDRPVARALARAVAAVAAEDIDLALVTGASPDAVAAATDELARELARTPAIASAMARVPVTEHPSPTALFDALVRRGDDATLRALAERFGPGGADAAASRVVAVALAPGGGAMREQLTGDPYDLAPLLGARLSHLGAGVRPGGADGALVSDDGRARLVVLRARGSAFDLAFDDRMAAALEAVARRVAARHAGVRVQWTGPHAVARATRDLIRDDLTRSSVLASVLVTLVLLVAMRRVRALLGVGAALLVGAAWTSALAAVALRGLNAVTVAFAAIVLGVGLDTGVHLYDRVLRERRAGHPAPEAAARATREMARPLLVAAITAAAAFASLCASELRALRELGVLAAAGELLTAVAILLLTPPLAALLERGPLRGAAAREAPGAPARALAWLAGARYAPHVVLAVIALVVLSLALGPRPRLADTVVLVRPRALAPLAVQEEIFARFGGEPGQWIAVGGAPDVETALAASERVERALAPLAERGLLAGYDSVAALAPSLAGQRARRAAVAALDPAGAADRLAAALASRGLRAELFEPGLAPLRAAPPEPVAADPFAGPAATLARRFIARARDGGVTYLAYVRPAHGRDTARVRAAVTAALREADPGLTLTGYPLLEADVRAALRADALRVGGLAAGLVALLLLLSLRRVRPVVLALAAVGVEIAALMALLGWFGVRLDAYNLLAVPVLVGITIDEVVFVLHEFDEASGDGAARARAAVGAMAGATGATAAATAAGFFALAACRFEALEGLGLVAGAGTALGFVAAVLVVPALARLGAPRETAHHTAR